MKRKISILLALMMAVCMVGAVQVTAYAATTAKSVSLSTTTYTYDGKVKKPKVTAKDKKGKKIAAKYYTVKYPSGRKNVGTYTVKVKFKGKYKGTKSASFKIVPKGTAVSSVPAGKKSFTVKWKKQATQTTGYQVQYAENSRFKSASSKTVSKNSTTSLKVNGKPIKKYYVRVRTYKKVGKTNYYSSWSKASSVTTKTGLSLNAYKITLFNGETYTLKCTGTNKKITWQTSDPTVAVVNRSGEISANGSGQCTITAKTADDRISCKVTVPEYYPENYNVPDFGAYFNVPLIDYYEGSGDTPVQCVYSYAAVARESADWLDDYYDILWDYGFRFCKEEDKREEESNYYISFYNQKTDDMIMVAVHYDSYDGEPQAISVLYYNTTGY